jgi:hypothetical protein
VSGAGLLEIYENLRAALYQQTVQCKINVSFAFVLKRKGVEEEYRVFYASRNNTIFEYPPFIQTTNDIEHVMTRFQDKDIIDGVAEGLSTSKWTIFRLLSMTVFVYKTNLPLY